MGLALGDLASISYRRVQDDAADFGVKIETVLGPTLAHEVGHLLLASEGHSPSGIMREHWQREDYERAPRGAFKFTSKQARTISTEVRERAEKQATIGLESHTDRR
jgi:hypothetical protein